VGTRAGAARVSTGRATRWRKWAMAPLVSNIFQRFYYYMSIQYTTALVSCLSIGERESPDLPSKTKRITQEPTVLLQLVASARSAAKFPEHRGRGTGTWYVTFKNTGMNGVYSFSLFLLLECVPENRNVFWNEKCERHH
jgi:hypothetical protein